MYGEENASDLEIRRSWKRTSTDFVKGLCTTGGYELTLVSMSVTNDYKGTFEDDIVTPLDNGVAAAKLRLLYSDNNLRKQISV